ncbi:methyltransferase domain-containing protein [Phaeovibrio sulfidiphilus]|uniref:Methyltransferase domain-containing protein n=1 Tax=Phaeovibrio sulfidiphilus TaxID=1220600 RepID=A0A8J6YK78_9PROT|nr:methyltransferase domain-containing protein [Phaeovibrio sulfidiphilus]MBE1237971.1 methyltransferase domain-containing protein [Phaeovibrio sulfidiphilus]
MGIKHIIKPFIPSCLISMRRRLRETRPAFERTCPVCGYHGYFEAAGKPLRLDARCPKCGSMERHRLFWLWYTTHADQIRGPVLHFAPEACLRSRLKDACPDYRTADLFERDVDLALNIEDTGLETGSLNTIVCNHVLEHVDDRKALRELCRILSDDGLLICSVPIVESWSRTWEQDSVTTAAGRELQFGQADHLRIYGHDFRDRLREAGFGDVREVIAQGWDVGTYGLVRGDVLFLCRKS